MSDQKALAREIAACSEPLFIEISRESLSKAFHSSGRIVEIARAAE
jgi:hypothetical protein